MPFGLGNVGDSFPIFFRASCSGTTRLLDCRDLRDALGSSTDTQIDSISLEQCDTIASWKCSSQSAHPESDAGRFYFPGCNHGYCLDKLQCWDSNHLPWHKNFFPNTQTRRPRLPRSRSWDGKIPPHSTAWPATTPFGAQSPFLSQAQKRKRRAGDRATGR